MSSMSDALASALAVGFGALGLGALIAVSARNRRPNLSARTKAIWSLLAWVLVALAGAAIWVVSRQMVR
jgi:hypothetical protein